MEVFDSHSKLLDLSDNKYRDFSMSLNPYTEKIIGVRIPILRLLAKDILKTDWHTWLKSAPKDYLEDKTLIGLVICYAKITMQERLQLLKDFIPIVDNWATCDTVFMTLKPKKDEMGMVWDFIQPYFASKEEFEVRFAVVTSMSFFIDDQHIDTLFSIYQSVHHEGYYAKMAVAWAISSCCVKFPELTETFFQDSKLDQFTQNKAIQKCCESFRVSEEQKLRLRKLKR